MRKPFPHQEEARDFLVEEKKAILADEMGGGKTLSAILAGAEVGGKKLIVCPSSLKYNWKKEIELTVNESVSIIDGGRNWVNTDENGWTIINYDLLGKHINSILNQGYKVAIFDESHTCRSIDKKGNPTTARARMMIQISKEIEYVFLLTGTPVVNGNKDLFNMLRSIEHPLSFDFMRYGKRYCGGHKGKYGWDFNGNSRQEELFVRLQYKMLRRLKKDLLDLPKKVRSFIPVEVDLNEYNKQISDYMNSRALLNTEGKHLVKLNAMRLTIATEKVNHTISMAQDLVEQNESVVIFTNYSIIVDKIIERFRNNAVRIVGKDSAKERHESVERFQNGEVSVIVCNLEAGGVGLNLTRSSNMIVNDFYWIPDMHIQAEDRLHRIGQEQEVNIYYMYANRTIDEKIANLLDKKLENANRTVNGEKESFIGEIIRSLNS